MTPDIKPLFSKDVSDDWAKKSLDYLEVTYPSIFNGAREKCVRQIRQLLPLTMLILETWGKPVLLAQANLSQNVLTLVKELPPTNLNQMLGLPQKSSFNPLSFLRSTPSYVSGADKTAASVQKRIKDSLTKLDSIQTETVNVLARVQVATTVLRSVLSTVNPAEQTDIRAIADKRLSLLAQALLQNKLMETQLLQIKKELHLQDAALSEFISITYPALVLAHAKSNSYWHP